MKQPRRFSLLILIICSTPILLRADAIQVPDWALPGSKTHHQVPPPAGFHRPTVIISQPLGVFEGQADVGGPLLPGSASYDAGTKTYTLNSASYNVWYNRDEIRYLWRKMSGDVSLAVDVAFPNPDGYDDRKALLMVRQDLDDDAKEAMIALHGTGLIHLAVRPEKNADIKAVTNLKAKSTDKVRLGLEKHGDTFALYAGVNGGPMQLVGATATLHLEGPFYVGIAFCSHVPDKSDTTVLSNLVIANASGQVR